MEKPLLVQLTEVKLVKTSIIKLGFIHILTMLINMFNCTFGSFILSDLQILVSILFVFFIYLFFFIKKYAYSISLAIRLIIHVGNLIKDTKVR